MSFAELVETVKGLPVEEKQQLLGILSHDLEPLSGLPADWWA
jgi:hypothetical protein